MNGTAIALSIVLVVIGLAIGLLGHAVEQEGTLKGSFREVVIGLLTELVGYGMIAYGAVSFLGAVG
jgi:uncharacterized membrane protein YeaQ/YmgE (transglycosylase-associated protein family)